MNTTTTATLAQTIRHLQHLLKDLEAAQELQWERPPGTPDPDDPGIRSRGGHSDPTGDTVSHPARLALRASMAKVERAVPRLEEEAWSLGVELGTSLRKYRG